MTVAHELTQEEAAFLSQLPRGDCVTVHTTRREARLVSSLRHRGLITVTLRWDDASRYICPRLILITRAGADALAAGRLSVARARSAP